MIPNGPMGMSNTGLELTNVSEGLRLHAYQDVGGTWTIGYGHTGGVTEGQTCTVEQAQYWLRCDITTAVSAVNRLVDVELTQGEFDALVDFTYNEGAGRLEASTMLGLLNSGEYAKAADEFEKWDLAGGVVVAGLLRRRQAEVAEFETPAPVVAAAPAVAAPVAEAGTPPVTEA